MTLSTTPHDSLFRALVSNPRRAAALLREHLPNDMTALIDFQHPPEPQEGSFVDGTGAKSQCDALFRVRLKGGQDARVQSVRPLPESSLSLFAFDQRERQRISDSCLRPDALRVA